ncbi:NHL domain-containing protein [Taibaiella soli]|uniref:Uncharacterized protein n=1 Tax=Taibaiella soli TaxID=1649169 RepID=A0A2W2AW47_9BACT|nr:T9SS type A sorting domain-containing protein [Taibaiella soli]PZF72194.1 hypothetical protein DN068_14770 [Taibaiella soli]
MKKLLAIALSAICSIFSFAQNPLQIIRTVAGDPGAGAATSISVIPRGIATDASGNLFIVDGAHQTILKLNAAGNITIIAGNGAMAFYGDGGPATKAELKLVYGIAIDAAGNIYIGDAGNNRVRKISSSGIITTIAGTGTGGYSGDGGPATSAELNTPSGIAVDLSGNVYVADKSNNRIRKINASGIITTVAGSGTAAFGGDGGAAVAANLNGPLDVKVDAHDNLYISDAVNNRIRKVDASGTITTLVGTGLPIFSGDGGPATLATINNPSCIAIDTAGNLYINDRMNLRTRKVTAAGIISTIAGNGLDGFSGDGGAAPSAQISATEGIAVTPSGNIYIGDGTRIRKVNTLNVISTVAGNGFSSWSGDGGLALKAQLGEPEGVCFDTSGNMYIADAGNNRIRKVTPSGVISHIAGISGGTWMLDSIPANIFMLNHPTAVTADVYGNIYIADALSDRILKIDTNGIMIKIAGTGSSGYSGDGGPATLAQIYFPRDLKVDRARTVYFSDYWNHRIRKIDSTGIITTIAGTGVQGFSGDGGAATAAQISTPCGLALDPAGNLYFADHGNARIRKISPSGIITTIAGTGLSSSNNGDGGPAIAAQIAPMGVAFNKGSLYITDDWYRIRKIDVNGIISTIAGVDTADFQGDGGPATLAHLSAPVGITIGPSDAIYVADRGNYRIRRIGNPVTPVISIAASQDTVCPLTLVHFTATVAHEGLYPVYHWRLNGNNVGVNSQTFTYAFINGDTVSCMLTSSDPGAYPDTVISNTIAMNVVPWVNPTAVVAANPASSATSGQQIVFTANTSNTGANPAYQWRKNYMNIPGATNSTYIATAGVDVMNNDLICVVVKNTDSCGVAALSNYWSVAVLGSTGINTVNAAGDVAVYPNPSNGSFMVTGQLADNHQRTITLEVCNSVGQQIYRQNVAITNNTINQKIDLQKQVAPGVYFVRIIDGDKPRNLVVEIK